MPKDFVEMDTRQKALIIAFIDEYIKNRSDEIKRIEKNSKSIIKARRFDIG